MKDNWIKPFQDKLGDYELDLPPATSRRRFGWIVPMFIGTAAAALLTLLWLRTPEAGYPGTLEYYIAEVPARLDMAVPGKPAAFRQSARKRLPAGAETPSQTDARGMQAAIRSEQTAPDERQAAEGSEPEPVATRQATQAPAHDKRTGQIPQDADWGEDIPARRGKVTARLHISPLGLQRSASSLLPYAIKDFSMASQSDSPRQDLVAYVPADNNNFQGVSMHNAPSTRYDLPVKTGLSIRLPVRTRLSLESGINYSFQRADVSYGGNAFPAYSVEYRMHYVGIPLKAICSLASWERADLYAAAGAEAEWMFLGRMYTKTNGQAASVQRIHEHPFLFSLTAAAGAEYKFNTRLGLYAEPGIALHFKPQGDLPNYYREHPLSFDLHIGLRFTL